MPKTRNTAFVSYRLGDWGINLQDTWLGGFSRKTLETQVFAQEKLSSFNTIDISLDRNIVAGGAPVDIYFSVQNIANVQPPLSPTTAGAPGLTYPANPAESGMGRYFTIGVRGNL